MSSFVIKVQGVPGRICSRTEVKMLRLSSTYPLELSPHGRLLYKEDSGTKTQPRFGTVKTSDFNLLRHNRLAP